MFIVGIFIELFPVVHYAGESTQVSIFKRHLHKWFMFNLLLNSVELCFSDFHLVIE